MQEAKQTKHKLSQQRNLTEGRLKFKAEDQSNQCIPLQDGHSYDPFNSWCSCDTYVRQMPLISMQTKITHTRCSQPGTLKPCLQGRRHEALAVEIFAVLGLMLTVLGRCWGRRTSCWRSWPAAGVGVGGLIGSWGIHWRSIAVLASKNAKK